MEKVRLFALGGLDEDGKNLTVIEIDQKIFVIDAGLKYPEDEYLGVEIIIPDFSYLVENKDRIKAIFITHAHDDVMASLPFLLKSIKAPIYTTPLTALVLEDLFKASNVFDFDLRRIQRDGTFKIADTNIMTFGLTHSIADAFGLAIETSLGYIAYVGEFIIDFDNRNKAFACDITQFSDLGKKGVFALLTESVGSDRSGFTSPTHRISDFLENTLEDTKGRMIVTLYEQNLFRLLEVIEMAVKFKRKIFFYNQNQRELLRKVEKLGYFKMPMGIEISKEMFRNERTDVIVVVSGSGLKVFKMMHRIAMREDSIIELNKSDTVVIASPVVPGTELEAGRMENELYKEDVRVYSLNRKQFVSMHASIEDLKMLMYLVKPKYYIPIHGEYRHLVNNANIALDMGYYADKIIVLDNGQIATFIDGKLNDTKDLLKLEEIMIDRSEHQDISGLILKDRELLATDGVIIIGVVINFTTKKIIGGPDVQSRGVIYLKDADYIVKELGNIIENTIEEMVKDRRYENANCRNEVKERMTRYIAKETGKRPMVLPVIIELNVQE